MVDDHRDRETLIALTADLVSAHVSNNKVAVGDVPALISTMFEALSGLGGESIKEEVALEPAVPIRASVRSNYVVCLECGKKMQMLKRHLRTEHELTVEEYRNRWNLPAHHALVAPRYAAQRAELAKKSGFGGRGKGEGAEAGRKPKVKQALVSAVPLAKADAKPRNGR